MGEVLHGAVLYREGEIRGTGEPEPDLPHCGWRSIFEERSY
jgi:hypothetical protein